jgi:hypothetical protein
MLALRPPPWYAPWMLLLLIVALVFVFVLPRLGDATQLVQSLQARFERIPTAWTINVAGQPFVVRFGQLQQSTAPPTPAAPIEVVASTSYTYIGPPTISRDVYASVFCNQNGANSTICQQAPAMYDAIVAAGADPALELAHAGNESSFGTGGVGMAPWFNLHGIHGHTTGPCQFGESFYNGAPGDEIMQRYKNNADAVSDWVCLIKDSGLYYPERNDPESVLAIYCECGGPNGKADYVARMKAKIDGWRAQSQAPRAETAPVQAYASNPISIDHSAFGVNVRAALIANGNALQNVTIQPGETWSFNASVGNPDQLSLATIVHPGDGWCNLAARYAQVARPLGLTPQFEDHHAGDLGGGPENSVAIWNINGQPGSDGEKQDLEITNTLQRSVHFQAQQTDAGVVIVAW